jgi:hypothetical protein
MNIGLKNTKNVFSFGGFFQEKKNPNLKKEFPIDSGSLSFVWDFQGNSNVIKVADK